MTLLATFQVLLMRYGGQSDMVIGTPIVNRWPQGRGQASSLEGLIGLFVNTLVLRTDLSGNPSFLQLLARVREVTLQAYVHQDVPFEKLVDELQPQRSLSHQPLCQVLFSFQTDESSLHTLELPGLNSSTMPVESQTTKFDLSVMLSEGVGLASTPGLQTVVEYNTDLFDATTTTRLLRHWLMLLETIVHDAGQAIEMLPLLTPEERTQLLVAWNATQNAYPQDLCIHQLFEQQVELTPDAIAVVFEEAALTYSELNGQANRLAYYLVHSAKQGKRGQGNHDCLCGGCPVGGCLCVVGLELLVGVCIERSLELVIALLAILKAGGAYVPLDPRLPPERFAFMLEDAQVSIVLIQAHLRDSLRQSHKQLTTVRLITVESDNTLQDRDNPPCWVQPDNLAYLMYTSGSTGRPKGVQIAHRAVSNFLTAMSREPGLQVWDSLLAVTNVSFDIAGLELFLPLMTGARVVIVSREVAMDGAQLAQALREHGTTIMQATPATWRILLDAGWQGQDKMSILCGGEAFPPDLASRLLDMGGVVWNLYGPTETTIWSTLYPVTSGQAQSTTDC